jgi:magnesium transporter
MNRTDDQLLPLDELRAAWPLLSTQEKRAEFGGLSNDHSEELFEILEPVDQADILLQLQSDGRSRYLSLLAPDDLTDVFQAIEEGARRNVFKSLTPEALAEVQELAGYDEDDAGGLMTPDFAHALPGMTVDEAIVALRLQLQERPETLRYVYVLEKDTKLVGVVSFRELFGARPGASVRSLMETDLITVREDTDQEDVANLMQARGFSALPVVDSALRMKGIVTSDDMMEVIEDEATEDIHKLAGVAATDMDYARAGVAFLWRRRVGWLMILLFTGLVTAKIMEHFETTLSTAVVLVFFVPLIMGAAGNTGTQSAMLVIRALSTGELRARDWGRVLLKEMAVGLLLGIVLALALGVWGFFGPGGGTEIAYVLGVTMVIVVFMANLVGAILPVVVQALKLDPAVVSAPLVTTLVDATGLIIYFSVARLILGI